MPVHILMQLQPICIHNFVACVILLNQYCYIVFLLFLTFLYIVYTIVPQIFLPLTFLLYLDI